MSRERPLRGGCSCGRNEYIIEVPPNATEVAEVFFDNSASQRRSQATPLSAWIRVPLTWFHSTTYAFFDDETHSSIRRVYTSPREQHSKRHFCGYCGTPLSWWTESPASEADYISLTLGSLSGADLRELDELGILPEEFSNIRESTEEIVPRQSSVDLLPSITQRQGVPWFETLIEGSTLGNIRRTRGKGQTEDGQIKVEWEVMEWTDDGTEEETQGNSKRKLADLDATDAVMEGVH